MRVTHTHILCVSWSCIDFLRNILTNWCSSVIKGYFMEPLCNCEPHINLSAILVGFIITVLTMCMADNNARVFIVLKCFVETLCVYYTTKQTTAPHRSTSSWYCHCPEHPNDGVYQFLWNGLVKLAILIRVFFFMGILFNFVLNRTTLCYSFRSHILSMYVFQFLLFTMEAIKHTVDVLCVQVSKYTQHTLAFVCLGRFYGYFETKTKRW